MGWPKGSFGFFHKMLWKNSNEPFGQPDTNMLYIHIHMYMYLHPDFKQTFHLILPHCFFLNLLPNPVRRSLSVHITAVRATGICACHTENVPMQRAGYTSLCHSFCPSVHTPMPDCSCVSCSWQRPLGNQRILDRLT